MIAIYHCMSDKCSSATAVQNKSDVTDFEGALPDLCFFKGATGIGSPCKDLEKASKWTVKQSPSPAEQLKVPRRLLLKIIDFAD